MKVAALLLALMVLGLAAASGIVAGAEPIVLSGHVQYPVGAPFEGAEITIHNIDTNVSFSPFLTDENGDFSRSLSAGNYSVFAAHPSYNVNVSYSGLSASADDLDFTLYEVLGTVTGHVTDGNTTLSGVKIVLSNSNANFSALSTSPFGGFTMENVSAGTYIAYAVKDGYDGGSGIYPDPVMVVKGSTMDLNFTLTPLANQPAQVSGKVTYNGDPLPGVKVVLSPLEGSDLANVTDAQGNYLFKGVTPGEYDLLISKSGFVGTSQKVIVEPLKDKSIDLSMKKDALPGNTGFLMDYDLSHSLMIVALGLALSTTLAALIIRYRAGSRPGILENEDEE